MVSTECQGFAEQGSGGSQQPRSRNLFCLDYSTSVGFFILQGTSYTKSYLTQVKRVHHPLKMTYTKMSGNLRADSTKNLRFCQDIINFRFSLFDTCMTDFYTYKLFLFFWSKKRRSKTPGMAFYIYFSIAFIPQCKIHLFHKLKDLLYKFLGFFVLKKIVSQARYILGHSKAHIQILF